MSDEKKANRKRKPLPKIPKDPDALTPQQIAFVGALIQIGFQRAGDAYSIAYPNCKKSSADACASRLLKNAKVASRIEQEMNSMLAEKKRFLEHEIFNFWYIRATYDPTEIINLDGTLRIDVTELRRRGLHVVIDSINRKVSNKGEKYVEYKLADRDHAADKLNEYIHMIKPQPTLNLNLNKDVDDMTPEEENLYRENLRTAFPQLGEKKE